MKIPSRLILLGACLVVPFAAAAPDVTPKSEHWVSPQAQAVIDRVNAAYAAVEGWTASFTLDAKSVRNGSESETIVSSVERYLRNDGSIPCYAATHLIKNELSQMVAQSPEEMCQLIPVGPGKHVGKLSAPNEEIRPQMWATFQHFVKNANYVRSEGKESVAGQDCAVLELTQITPATKAEGETESAPVVSSVRCWVAPSGFIERLVWCIGSMDGKSSEWDDTRITYDPHARLSVSDFSRANFEREATAALKGRPMPELEQQLFPAGGSLPEVSFTGWADKKPFRLPDLHGKVVVLETWASWCHYCKQAFPFYEKMRQTLANQDVVFVAVSFDAKLADYEKWMNAHNAEYGFKFGHIDAADPAKALNDFKGSLPGFYVLGRDGKIVASYSGNGYEPGQEDPRLLKALRAAGIKL